MASVFRYRTKWRAQAFDQAGVRQTGNFRTQAEAKAWAANIEATKMARVAPELGGPTRATLAAMLSHYAHLYTVHKRGARQELQRIAPYLEAAGLPLLSLGVSDAGGPALLKVTRESADACVAPAWRNHLEKRRSQSVRTRTEVARLATMPAAAVSRADIDRLAAAMKEDGASASTIQKHIALLKHCFNQAKQRWNWSHIVNPCEGVRLGHSRIRFVQLSTQELDGLYRALAECDNPYVWPLVDVAIFVTARRSSLLRLTWSDVHIEQRRIVLRESKCGTVVVPMSERMVELFRSLPRHPSGRVFPMTENAVKCAWDGVRVKAKLPHLQFRDLRHVGGTYYAKLLPNAHVLKQVLGHKTTLMAEVYINLTSSDVVEALDAAERLRGPQRQMLPSAAGHASRKAQRVVDAIRAKQGAPRDNIVQFPVADTREVPAVSSGPV